MQRGKSLQGFFENPRWVAEHSDMPSPPNTEPLSQPATFDFAALPSPGFGVDNGLMGYQMPLNMKIESQHAATQELSPRRSSFDSALEMANMPSFEPSPSKVPISRSPERQNVIPQANSMLDLQPPSSPSKAVLSPRAMSITDLNLEPGIEATLEDTGITLDDIASYIAGPNPVDNKWTCTFDGCHKKFGRKENIKSHVQTHLGDRQFKCLACNKCFVRGHDLKRHARIHSGLKEYPCPCGNSFARQDALTRHRQRNMCIGGMGGTVFKQPVKRGRPRKHRPAGEERMDKANRTRRRVAAKEYASSQSGSSGDSWQSSPPLLDDLSIRGSSPMDDMPLFSDCNNDSFGFPPNTFTYTPPTSPPDFSTGNITSPESHASPAATDISHHSQFIADSKNVPSNLAELILSMSPHHGGNSEGSINPPDLLLNASSPATQHFDFEELRTNTHTNSTLDTGMNSQPFEKADISSFELPDMSDHAGDAFSNIDFGSDMVIDSGNYTNDDLDELFGENMGSDQFFDGF